MAWGLLVLRAVLGLTLAAHGSQKLFGWFGGGGPRGTETFFRGLGFRAPLVMAMLAAVAEFAGGLAFAAGLLTPVASFALVGVMLNAVALVHWRNGFWAGKGGFEFNLLILAAAVAVAMSGPGRLSLDRAIGWDGRITGVWWGLGVLAAAALASALTVGVGRYRPRAHPTFG